ncbi:MAG: NUDIX domain-containing protein [Candidatus Andersenbacteria bacterium]|nr:NUDIX domain-containing protein [Candidatus Andersenbacteria bacterium]
MEEYTVSQPTAQRKPALFKVGLFAFIARITGSLDVEFLVNVRTDQERQRKNAKLPDDWPGKIVDLPGGTFQVREKVQTDDGEEELPGDPDFESCLTREVGEETAGCEIKPVTDNFSPAFPLIKAETGTSEAPHDLAFIRVMNIIGQPRPNAEASEHRWVTLDQLKAETEVRFPGLGKNGRMARMATWALQEFLDHFKPQPAPSIHPIERLPAERTV